MFTPCEHQIFSLTLPPQAIKRNDEFHVSSLPAETVQRDFLVLSPQNRRKRHQTINPSSFTFTPLCGLARAPLGPSAISRAVNIPKVQFYYRNSRKFNYPHPLPENQSSRIRHERNDYKLNWIQILLLIIIWGVRYGVPFFLGLPGWGLPPGCVPLHTSPCLQFQCRNEQKRQQTNAERTFHNA